MTVPSSHVLIQKPAHSALLGLCFSSLWGDTLQGDTGVGGNPAESKADLGEMRGRDQAHIFQQSLQGRVEACAAGWVTVTRHMVHRWVEVR